MPNVSNTRSLQKRTTPTGLLSRPYHITRNLDIDLNHYKVDGTYEPKIDEEISSIDSGLWLDIAPVAYVTEGTPGLSTNFTPSPSLFENAKPSHGPASYSPTLAPLEVGAGASTSSAASNSPSAWVVLPSTQTPGSPVTGSLSTLSTKAPAQVRKATEEK